MKTTLFTILLVLVLSSLSFSQELNFSTNGYKLNSEQSKKFSDNLFYGGEFSASFGSYSQVTIAPSIGYKFNNMISTILKIGYSRAWQSDYKDASGNTIGYNQFGTSISMRFAPVRQFYALLEPAYYSYENPVLIATSIGGNYYYDKERKEVPFIYLGAGFYQQIANSGAGITGELKVDVLNDKNSPYYGTTTPVYSLGIVYGF
ncbi:MAG: hypothetical protein NTY74_05105 [Ignavibacteriae bacterium]|nr:hypothetical protein [Ignavibacteriota bacterium]